MLADAWKSSDAGCLASASSGLVDKCRELTTPYVELVNTFCFERRLFITGRVYEKRALSRRDLRWRLLNLSGLTMLRASGGHAPAGNCPPFVTRCTYQDGECGF